MAEKRQRRLIERHSRGDGRQKLHFDEIGKIRCCAAGAKVAFAMPCLWVAHGGRQANQDERSSAGGVGSAAHTLQRLDRGFKTSFAIEYHHRRAAGNVGLRRYMNLDAINLSPMLERQRQAPGVLPVFG